MEGDLDLVPTKLTKKPKRASQKYLAKSYRPDRVKSSIPKMGEVTSFQKSKNTARYVEDMKKQEVERAVKLNEEEKITLQVLEKMRDNPNSSLNELQNEVALLNRKVEPILQRVEQAAKNVYMASSQNPVRRNKGPVGMLAKMGGRLISFYSDELTDLMLNDFLIDTA